MTQIGKRRKVRATIHSARRGSFFLAAERGRREGGEKRGSERDGGRVRASVGQGEGKGKKKRSPRDN